MNRTLGAVVLALAAATPAWADYNSFDWWADYASGLYQSECGGGCNYYDGTYNVGLADLNAYYSAVNGSGAWNYLQEGNTDGCVSLTGAALGWIDNSWYQLNLPDAPFVFTYQVPGYDDAWNLVNGVQASIDYYLNDGSGC